MTFFLVAYQLQVAAGWSALAAGIALLPGDGADAGRSPRRRARSPSGSDRGRSSPSARCSPPPVCCCSRVSGRTPRGSADVLPGAIVFGLGLVTFVAPLTATVMAAADPDHVSVASGVNNAIARAAALTALAMIPVMSGLCRRPPTR